MCWVSEPWYIVSRVKKVPWHNTGLSWQNLNESKTQQPVSDRKQLHRRRKWGVWASLLGHNSQSCGDRGGLNKRTITQETVGHLQTSHVCCPALIVLVFIYWLPSHYSSTVHFKDFLCHMLVKVSSYSLLLCVCRERFWWDQPQEQLACKHHDCSAKRYNRNTSWYETNDHDSCFMHEQLLVLHINWSIGHSWESDIFTYIIFFLICRVHYGAPTQHKSFRACSKTCSRCGGNSWQIYSNPWTFKKVHDY